MLNLSGKKTPDGWLIEGPVPFAPDHTGGYFSSCFYVRKNEQRAFLKALDIEKFEIEDLISILSGFQYETEIVSLCNEKKLSRVVKALEKGRIERDASAPTVLRYVPFLVFELAEGDIRNSVDVSIDVTDQWRFYVLHQTTLALLQLHAQNIAHQDLKPSNVLRFGNDRLKLGDLGRSSLRGKTAPHDSLIRPGALPYAPFEQLYNYVPTDWIERRLSTDVFHLGCLAVFSFTNCCFPEYVIQKLANPYKPNNWGNSYHEVLPHVQAAIVQALDELSGDFPNRFRTQLVEIVLDLCHPDPTLRGRAGTRDKISGGSLWLQRYVSKFDILEKSARLKY